MLVSEILQTLPASLEWMVLFDLSAISKLADSAIVRAMYHLPPEIELDPYTHVVLTSEGRFLASSEESKLVEATSGNTLSSDRITNSLYEKFSSRLALFPVDEAHCLGLGEMQPYSPVLLHIIIKSGFGQAKAVFDKEPSKQDYELLRSVGVKFLGGETKDSYYLARFQNRLPVHIHAGFLSHFSRTAHCNLFFLQQGYIDPPLKTGLLQASESRVIWGRNTLISTLAKLASEATERSMAMTCQPPLPERPFPYGDLVPLGFVLKALNKATAIVGDTAESNESKSILEARQGLSKFLLDKRQDKLWAFQTNRLITATDSALVLQGFNEPESVEALELFADGEGGYYPQLWSEEKLPGKMVFDRSCAHWCQSDYATTCLVKTLRQEAQLETKTSTEYLAAGMANRSGLYFANPYLVDWVLASAIKEDESASSLREQLLAEILTSMNEDYSFGLYDVAMSTALAILCMGALGFRGRTMRVAQLRLLEFIDSRGLLPVEIPFYSSLSMSEVPANALMWGLMNQSFTSQTSNNKQKQIANINGQYHSISLYKDTHQTIGTAIAALALSEECSPSKQDLVLSDRHQQEIHPRYQCSNHSEYIAKFALPPYVKMEQQLQV
ncbi:MAG: hypothetical protein QNJ54_04785 [Prochloraceae cyanobacterium]|nr:hypothetical protein [Prochloraceae cyanobacterium]